MNDILPLEIFYIYFSPYTSHAVELDGVLYPTVEHAYQCKRYKDIKIINEILNSRSPVKAWETSCKYKHLQIPEYKDKEYKYEMMKKIMKQKALQHEEVKKALLDSGNLKIVKKIITYPRGDGYWDIGEDGKGLNKIGQIWMEIRDELK